jgi:hypothetical protein
MGAPQARSWHTAVWTGSRMIVWGGQSEDPSTYLANGGLYDPLQDVWSPTSLAGAPSARRYHSAVWTGSQMIIWGGQGAGSFASGARYDPSTDAWTPTAMTNTPTPRERHAAAWTGSRMVVWEGMAAEVTGGGTTRWPTSGLPPPP